MWSIRLFVSIIIGGSSCSNGESISGGKFEAVSESHNDMNKEKPETLFMCCEPTIVKDNEGDYPSQSESRSLGVKTETLFRENKCSHQMDTEQYKIVGIDNSESKATWVAPGELMSNGISKTFALEYTQLNCNQEFRMTLLPNVSDPSNNGLYPNGYLRIGIDFYANDEYCIESFTEDSLEVKVCIPDCKSRACIPKCCEYSNVYSVGIKGKRGCQPPMGDQPVYFDPPLYKNLDQKLSPEERKLIKKPHYFLWKKKDFKYNCYMNSTTIAPLSDAVARNLSLQYNHTFHSVHFRLRSFDGALMYKNLVEKKCMVELNPKKGMCFDGVQDYSSENDGFSNREDEYIVYLCTAWNLEGRSTDNSALVYGILMLGVAIFPLMTCIVYISLWKKMNIHGWTITNTSGTLFLMYLFQGSSFTIGNLGGRENTSETWGCTLIAILAHFSFLACHSWTLVMSFDLFNTFRSLTPTNRRSKGRKRYFYYSVFAWGLPSIYVSTGVFLDFSHLTDDCTPHILPGYGTHNCNIIPSSQGVYLLYPSAALLSINLVFFTFTCFKLLRYRRNTKIATKRETDHWRGFTRFTKLFFVMGVSWIFEIVSWSIDGLTLKWYWVIGDLFNILRAIGVFIIYVCKQDILVLLEELHPTLKKFFRPFKRKCSSDDYAEQTGSTAAVAMSPINTQPAPNFPTSK